MSTLTPPWTREFHTEADAKRSRGTSQLFGVTPLSTVALTIGGHKFRWSSSGVLAHRQVTYVS